MSIRQTGPTTHDPRPPRALVRRPDEDARAEEEQLRQAVAALERVRTQLARTQRTLDAFVAQITGAPDGAAMRVAVPSPTTGPAGPAVERPASAPTSDDAGRALPPGPLADHVLPAPELLAPRPPRVEPAPEARTVPAAPPVALDADRPEPPAPIADHVTPPGERLPGTDEAPFLDPAVAAAAAEAGRRPADLAPPSDVSADGPAPAPGATPGALPRLRRPEERRRLSASATDGAPDRDA